MARKKTTEVVEPVASPSLSEFSDKAASKAINRKIFGSPWTVYPIVLGLAVGVGGALIAAPVVAIAGLAGLAVGAGHVVVKCAQSGRMKDEYIAEVKEKIAEANEQKRRNIRPMLKNCADVLGAREIVDQAVAQFDIVETTFNGLMSLLDRKLDQTEMAYGMFVGSANKIVGSMLDNLSKVVNVLTGIRSINVAHIERQLQRIYADGRVDEREAPEESALQERKRLREDQLIECQRMLTTNEQALTLLQKTIADVVRMKSGERFSQGDMDSAMASIKRIAEMAEKF